MRPQISAAAPIVPLSIDERPTLALFMTPENPTSMDTIIFRAEAVDPEGDPLKYDWIVRDEQGNNIIDKSKTAENTLQWEKPPAGSYTLLVIVTDYHPGGGGVIWKQMPFTVREAPPSPEPRPTYSIITGSEGDEEPLAFVQEIRFNGQTLFRDAVEERTYLWPGASIATGPGVEIIVRFSSGALIRIDQNTEYELKKPEITQAGLRTYYSRLIKGLMNFYFPPGAAAQRKFEIETDMAITSIKGTELTIEHTAGVTTVTVVEGEVEVTDKATGAVSIVRAGETARFDGTTPPPPSGGKTLEQALDTNNNKIIDDLEMLQALQYWIKQQTVPGTNKTIDDLTMLALLQKWIKGTPI